MFNFGAKTRGPNKLAGPGFITLNVIRVLNIISLLAVAVASWIMLIETVMKNKFSFFDEFSHFIASVISVFLIASELSICKSYFEKWWPLLSNKSGFFTLGLCMIILGAGVLGNLDKEATSLENLGLPLWREVIAAGILSAAIGFFNIIAGFVFGQIPGVTSRQIRADGANASPASDPSDSDIDSVYLPKRRRVSPSTIGSGAASPSRAASFELPSYHSPSRMTASPPEPASAVFSPAAGAHATSSAVAATDGAADSPAGSEADTDAPRATAQNRQRSWFGFRFATSLSGNNREPAAREEDADVERGAERYGGPIAEEVEQIQRPPTALHPAYSPSRYSVSSRASRF